MEIVKWKVALILKAAEQKNKHLSNEKHLPAYRHMFQTKSGFYHTWEKDNVWLSGRVRPKINMAELSELVELWKSTAFPCRKLEIENCQEKNVVLFSSQERGISRYNVSVNRTGTNLSKNTVILPSDYWQPACRRHRSSSKILTVWLHVWLWNSSRVVRILIQIYCWLWICKHFQFCGVRYKVLAGTGWPMVTYTHITHYIHLNSFKWGSRWYKMLSSFGY